MPDPFRNDHFLELDYDTSAEESESWQAALGQNADEGTTASERTSVSRLKLFYVGLVAILLLLFGRLLWLQVVNSEHNKALAEGNRVRETEIRAPRGVVYDAKRGILARNVANFEVTVVPSELPRKEPDRQAIYQRLSEILAKPAAEVKAAAEAKGLRSGQPVLVAEKLDRERSLLLRLKGSDLAGVHTEDNPQRQYDRASQFAHVLGYTGRISEDELKLNPDFSASDYVGKGGLEKVYEKELRGTAGKQRVEVNSSGQSVKELQSTEPQRGQNLVLGIDPDLQATMATAVEKGVTSSKRKATGGSAIALNPKNGEILGMVSAPSFDNNLFVGGIEESRYRALADNARKPLFNRPVSGEYPPGSTFKIVTATGALAENVVQPTTSLSSPPELNIDGYRFPDWKAGGHGSADAARALAVSSDVYFYKVAGGYEKQTGLGEGKLADYMRKFNIGKSSGIDLPEERTGLVPTPEYKQRTAGEPWYIGNTYQMGIGQGFVLTTPMQVLNYTAAIAGNGTAFKPHLVKAVENPDNPADVKAVKPEPLVNLGVDSEVLKTVQQGMRRAVADSDGTARELASLPVEVCGKTGSAEFANETNAHAWFTAYAPCNDPQIALTVMIEGGGEGADVAVPAAKSILEQFFKLPPSAPPAKPAIPPSATGSRSG